MWIGAMAASGLGSGSGRRSHELCQPTQRSALYNSHYQYFENISFFLQPWRRTDRAAQRCARVRCLEPGEQTASKLRANGGDLAAAQVVARAHHRLARDLILNQRRWRAGCSRLLTQMNEGGSSRSPRGYRDHA